MTADHVRLRESMAAAKELLNGLLSDRRVVQERIESAKAVYRSSLTQFERERDAVSSEVRSLREHKARFDGLVVLPLHVLERVELLPALPRAEVGRRLRTLERQQPVSGGLHSLPAV